MPDLHTRLAEAAEQLTPGVVPPFADVRRRARRRSRARTTAASVGVLVLALVGAFVAVAVVRPQPAPVAAPTEADRQYASETLSFRYPAAWNVYGEDGFLPDGQNGDGSFLKVSSEDAPFPCRLIDDGGLQVSCAVDATLADGGVLISWYRVVPALPARGGTAAPAPSAANPPAGIDDVGGWPGEVENEPADGSCRDLGAEKQLRVTAFVGPDDRAAVVSMTACLAAPYEQTERQVRGLLDSLTITP